MISDTQVDAALDAWFGERMPRWREARQYDVHDVREWMRRALVAADAVAAVGAALAVPTSIRPLERCR